MKRKLLTIVLLTATLVFTLAACGDSSEPSADDGGLTVLRLGAMAPLTGVNAEFGLGFQAAWNMAIEDLNAAGGTANGYTFELVIRDSRGEPMESADIAREFSDDPNILAILGDFTSGSAMAAAPVVDEAGIVLLSPTASSPDFAPMSDYTFGIVGLQSGESPFAAEQIIQRYLGASTVGLIWVNSDWGHASHRYFEATAQAIGLDIVESVNYVPDEMDFSALITQLRAADPEVVVIMDQGAVPHIINQIRGTGWDVQLYSHGPGTSTQLLEQTGANSEGLITISPFFFDPDNAPLMEWASRFEAITGWSPTVHPASAYDTLKLIAYAVESLGDQPITRSALRDAVAATDRVVGITGHIRFNPTGDLFRDYLIAGVVDGEWLLLEDFGFADR